MALINLDKHYQINQLNPLSMLSIFLMLQKNITNNVFLYFFLFFRFKFTDSKIFDIIFMKNIKKKKF